MYTNLNKKNVCIDFTICPPVILWEYASQNPAELNLWCSGCDYHGNDGDFLDGTDDAISRRNNGCCGPSEGPGHLGWLHTSGFVLDNVEQRWHNGRHFERRGRGSGIYGQRFGACKSAMTTDRQSHHSNLAPAYLDQRHTDRHRSSCSLIDAGTLPGRAILKAAL